MTFPRAEIVKLLDKARKDKAAIYKYRNGKALYVLHKSAKKTGENYICLDSGNRFHIPEHKRVRMTINHHVVRQTLAERYGIKFRSV